MGKNFLCKKFMHFLIYQKFDFLISEIVFEIRNYFQEIPILWYQKIISDIRKSIVCYQKNIFWYQKIGI